MNKKVIDVKNLRKTYGSVVAVEEISFEVYEGEIFGIVGPNGAGKTTTVECVEGIRKPKIKHCKVTFKRPEIAETTV